MQQASEQQSVPAGAFVVAWLREMESRGLRAAYLRNYEDLPADVGNDVDLLVERGRAREWTRAARESAPRLGWRFLRSVRFGCTSLFFHSLAAPVLLHVDLNEGLDWHFVPFARETAILDRRQWNGQVHIPAPEDELFLNVATRLLYQGRVREKHRRQWTLLRPRCDEALLVNRFASLGSASLARRLVSAADAADWDAVEALARQARLRLSTFAAFRRPARLLRGMADFATRAVCRLASPPGIRFAFAVSPARLAETKTALDAIAPSLAHWGNLSECRVLPPAAHGGGARIRMFRAKNGVTAEVRSSAMPPATGRNVVAVPVGEPPPDGPLPAVLLAAADAAALRWAEEEPR